MYLSRIFLITGPGILSLSYILRESRNFKSFSIFLLGPQKSSTILPKIEDDYKITSVPLDLIRTKNMSKHISSHHVSVMAHSSIPPGCRSYVTGSIHGWSRSHLTYVPGRSRLEERKLTSHSPTNAIEFSVQYNTKITSVICIYQALA